MKPKKAVITFSIEEEFPAQCGSESVKVTVYL